MTDSLIPPKPLPTDVQAALDDLLVALTSHLAPSVGVPLNRLCETLDAWNRRAAPSLPSAPLEMHEWVLRFMKYGEHQDGCCTWKENRQADACDCGFTNDYYAAEKIVGPQLHIEQVEVDCAPLPSALSAADREWIEELAATYDKPPFDGELAARYRRILSACTAERERVDENSEQAVRVEILTCDQHDYWAVALNDLRITPHKCCGSWRVFTAWPSTVGEIRRALKSPSPSLAPEGETP